MHVLGIDPSLTSTGYAYRDDEDVRVGSLTQKEARSLKRLNNIALQVEKQAEMCMCQLAVVEGYAFAFKTNASRAHSLGEIGGIIKYTLWEKGISLLLVPPNSLKMFALGHYKTVQIDAGGRKRKVKVKDLVKYAAEAEAGRRFANTDQSDAYWLLRMGEAYLDPSLLPRVRPNTKRDALAGCEYVRGKGIVF
jgi:Holliday junction resolvasome RuvABC endonuclease subunit